MSHAKNYQDAYLNDYGFEQILVSYRRTLVLERLNKHKSRVVLEIGCGNELQYQHWLQNKGRQADCWIIAEPAPKFAQIALEAKLPNCHVIPDTVENATDQIRRLLPKSPDMVICSGVLHEVPSPVQLLTAAKSLMGPKSVLHVNVPNSESFHRQLAKSMGLIASTKAFSNRNTALLQHRVYDTSAIHAELYGAGFTIKAQGGYLIKPFTHEQMERISGDLGPAVLDGLFRLGKEIPELASEIWVEVVRAS